MIFLKILLTFTEIWQYPHLRSLFEHIIETVNFVLELIYAEVDTT